MALSDYAHLLGPALFAAIDRKGYAELTAVQRAVLDPALAGRDLRITSQTGSGKTLAIGLTLRELAGRDSASEKGVARPLAIVVAPTRELAHQVEQELGWLYEETAISLATTTGGSSYRDEHRALAKGPTVVVGTPGRLLDHLKRGSIDPSQVSTVVLDEADRMLDLGFREDLEALFEMVPEGRATHLVSATFPRMVRSLADRLQRDPARVEGTRLGAANADIDHVIHVVDPAQRLDALINLLLAYPEDQTLVFVRTRADAAHVANELVVTGFAASALSGEMEQAARNRALTAFKAGGLRVLVATDVAARGIDVSGVARVVHGELPTNADAYTHRAGRTGRAGRKGTSSLLVAPIGAVRASRLLRDLGIEHRFEPIPSAEEILRTADEQLFAELTADNEAEARVDVDVDVDVDVNGDVDGDGDVNGSTKPTPSDNPRWRALAKRLLEAGELERTLTRLLKQARRGVTEPRNVRVFPMRPQHQKPSGRQKPERGRAERGRPERERARERPERGRIERERLEREHVARERPERKRVERERPEREHVQRERPEREHVEREHVERAQDELQLVERYAEFERGPDSERQRPERQRPERERPPRPEEAHAPRARKQQDREERIAAKREADAQQFKSFHVSWGQRDGADARRLLAMLCRRGKIRGQDVGAIRVEQNFSLVQVANAVAPGFQKAASRPDPREPHIFIRPDKAQQQDEDAAPLERPRTKANPYRPHKARPPARPPKRRTKR